MTELVDRQRLNQIALDTCAQLAPKFSLAAAAAYAGFAVLYGLRIPGQAYGVLAPLTGGTAAVFATLGLLWRRRRPSLRGTHLWIGASTALVLVNVAAEYALSHTPSHGAGFILAEIAFAVCLPTPMWLFAFMTAGVTTWAATTWAADIDVSYQEGALAFVSATLIGVAVFYTRRRAAALVESLRIAVEVGRDRELRGILDVSADAVLLHHRGRIVYANPALAAILGTTTAEITGQRVTSLIVPGPGAVALLDGRSGPHTIVVVRSDAERVALEISEPREIQFDGQPVVMWFGRDVTASQHALHAQLVRADRMAVVGRLAAGLAHELNNPLAALTLDVSHLKEVVPSAEPTVSAVLADVGAGIARIAAIVRELGTVSFREREPVNAVDVVTTLRLVLEIAAPEIQGHAEIRAELEPVPPISIAKSHLVQALLNLLIAVRAMDDDNRGAHTITVRTHTNAIGRVEIEIGGTALSIPPEDRERVFEPFFSTRADGFGGGLGLYHCQAVIAAASGTVTTSTSSRGTTFHISFPPAQMAGRAEGCDAAPDPLRVLVIDDEPAVGRAIKRLLVDCDVTVATSGTEGIARYEEHAPDLVLCDIMMPGLSGPGVYERLVSRDLGLANRIVFMTGGAFTKNTRKFVESTPSRVLKKPVELATLREVIAEHRVRPRVRGGDATGRDHHSRGVDRDEPSARRSS